MQESFCDDKLFDDFTFRLKNKLNILHKEDELDKLAHKMYDRHYILNCIWCNSRLPGDTEKKFYDTRLVMCNSDRNKLLVYLSWVCSINCFFELTFHNENISHKSYKYDVLVQITPERKRCWNCMKVADIFYTCSSCKKALYCNNKCQKENWIKHGNFCKKEKEKRLKKIQCNS